MSKVVIELTMEQAGDLGWLLLEQVNSLKKLQRKELDEMQPVIDKFQGIVDILLEALDGKSS